MYFVYILRSKKVRRYYTGMTKDLIRRLYEHNMKRSTYSKRYAPWIIIYTEEYTTKEEARKREKYLKSAAGRRFLKNKFNT